MPFHLAPWMADWMPPWMHHWMLWGPPPPAGHGALMAVLAVSGGLALAGLEAASRRLRRGGPGAAARVSAPN